MWFQILSELFVNFAAAWFAAAFIQPQFSNIINPIDILSLILKLLLGILSLVIVKELREKAREK